MSEMAQVVDRDPTAVDACFAWDQWCEGLGAASEGVGEPQVQRFLGLLVRLRPHRALCCVRGTRLPRSLTTWLCYFRLIDLNEAEFFIAAWMNGVMCLLVSLWE